MHQKIIMFMFLFCLLPQSLLAATQDNTTLTPGAMLVLGKDTKPQQVAKAQTNDVAETIGASNLNTSSVAKKPVPAKKWVGIHVHTKPAFVHSRQPLPRTRVYYKHKVKPPVRHKKHLNHSHLHHVSHVKHHKGVAVKHVKKKSVIKKR